MISLGGLFSVPGVLSIGPFPVSSHLGKLDMCIPFGYRPGGFFSAAMCSDSAGSNPQLLTPAPFPFPLGTQYPGEFVSPLRIASFYATGHRLDTVSAHGISNGTVVTIADCTENVGFNGTWTSDAVNGTYMELLPSSGAPVGAGAESTGTISASGSPTYSVGPFHLPLFHKVKAGLTYLRLTFTCATSETYSGWAYCSAGFAGVVASPSGSGVPTSQYEKPPPGSSGGGKIYKG